MIRTIAQNLQQPAIHMFGFTKCAFLVLSAGYLTLALPLERKQRMIEPQINMEVIQQGPPCETRAQMGDDVLINIDGFRVTGNEITRVSKQPKQIRLGGQYMPSLVATMVGTCPGEIRRVSVTYPTTPDNQGYTNNYDMELVRIGVVIPPMADTNLDNVVDIIEFADYLRRLLEVNVPDQVAIEVMFNDIDTNGDGVIDFNEWQTVSD